MKKEDRKVLISEVYAHKDKVFVYKEDYLYFFESCYGKLPIYTNDYLEAVASFMKLKEIRDFDKFWNINITSHMKENINVKNILYWVTGGDRTWNSDVYKYSWDDVFDLFIDEYVDIILDINQMSRNMLEVRKQFNKYLSLPIIYEFSLNNNLIA